MKVEEIVVVLIYLVPLLITLWFMVNIVSSFRDQNKILRQIANKLEHLDKKIEKD